MPWINTKRIIGVLVLVTIVGLLGLLFLEFTLRITSLGNVVRRPQESKDYYFAHSSRIIDIKPNVTNGEISFYGASFPFWSNELGCFDDAYKGESPFIYLAGDSLSWGYAPYDDKWGTRLEHILGIRVLKCAVSATGTGHQQEKAREILTLHPNPKIILVGYFAQNDALDDYYFPQFLFRDGDRVDNPEPSILPTEETYAKLDNKIDNYKKYCKAEKPSFAFFHRIKCFLHKHSALYILVTNGIKSLVGIEIHKNGSIFPDPPESAYKKHFSSIDKFTQLAAEHGAKIVFVMIPSREEIYPKLFGQASTTAKDRVITYFKEQGISYVDIAPVFKDVASKRRELHVGIEGDLYWPVEWHLNIRGNLVVAHTIGTHLVDSGSIERTNMIMEALNHLEQEIYAE